MAVPFADYPRETGHYEVAWEEMEQACRPTLDAEAQTWVLSRHWPQLTPQHEYFFWLRFITSMRFLRQFPTSSSSIFQFPALPLDEVLQWMLSPWWSLLGRHEALFHVEEPDFGPSLN
jgi:hypothetical protein